MDETSQPDDQIDEQSIERIQRARNIWYLNPVEILNGIWEFLSQWWNTRNWKAVSVIVVPLLLLFGLCGLVLIGKFRPRASLRAWYQEQASVVVEKMTEDLKEGREPLASDASKADLLLKRILQLGNEDVDSRFFVAQQNILLGRIDSARRMIERLSPADRPGMPQGHAWLAKELLIRASRGEPVKSEIVRHHLKNSVERLSEGIDAQLFVVYASMLDSDKQTTEAARFLKKAGEVDPDLQLKVIEYFIQRNLPNQAKGAADSLIEKLSDSLKQKYESEKEKGRDVILVARAYLLTQRPDESIAVLNSHAPKEDNPADWKRCLSDSYRAKFRGSLVKTDQQIQVNLNFLNASIASDPTNLDLRSDLLILREMGIASTPDRRQALVTLIAKDGNSLVPKLMLADWAISNGDFQGAISYYELVLAELPELTLALNNLAALQLKTSPPNFERATALIDKAIQISPNAEFYDTKGDIERDAGRTTESIQNYLSALNLAPLRQSTRQKLIAQYVAAGNEEDASKQRTVLDRVDQELERLQEERQKAIDGAKVEKPKVAEEPPASGEPPTGEKD